MEVQFSDCSSRYLEFISQEKQMQDDLVVVLSQQSEE